MGRRLNKKQYYSCNTVITKITKISFKHFMHKSSSLFNLLKKKGGREKEL